MYNSSSYITDTIQFREYTCIYKFWTNLIHVCSLRTFECNMVDITCTVTASYRMGSIAPDTIFMQLRTFHRNMNTWYQQSSV